MSGPYTTLFPPPERGPPTATPSTTSQRKSPNLQPRIRRRNRQITSCLECRRRKLKCDKQPLCANCKKFDRSCVFITPGLDPEAQARLAEVKEKMGLLERTLEEDVARKGSKSGPKTESLGSPSLLGRESIESDQEEDEYAKDLELNSLAVADAAYFEGDGDDDLADLGIAIGKLRITERIGGLVRPRFSEELAQALKEVPETNTPSPYVNQTPASWMGPGPDYLVPTSSFFFAPGVEKTSLMAHLPSRVLADKLMTHYWEAVHVIARTLHRPSFQRHYETFWTNINNGVEPRISFQAVVFAALFSSAISMTEARVLTEFGVDKQDLVNNFKRGTEAALARANFLRTTKLETLQALVMYLIPLCRLEVSRAHTALTGTVIRLAECMGLHRDPSQWTSSPIEIHLRRLVWYQICFLDLRTCEATGPHPQIRLDDYDTKFPLNVDDVDLELPNAPTEDRKYFTDMTITRMRFECHETQRLLWVERAKLDKKKVTLTSILSRIQAFKAAMEKTYLPMLNRSMTHHVLAMEIYGVLTDKMYIGVLQRYASSDRTQMPERLRQMLMCECVMMLEHAMTIEEQPVLAIWGWYLGALQQYHAGLLLLSEMYAGQRPESIENRIWRVLNYVFDMPAGLTGPDRSRFILEELVQRTSVFQKLRGTRAPTNMPAPGRRVLRNEAMRAQSEEKDHERSSSEPSGINGSFTASGAGQPPMSAMGTMPNTDFSSINFNNSGIPIGGDPSNAAVDAPYNFNFASVGPLPGAMPTGMSPDSAALTANTVASSGSPGSVIIPDIDWNEWEKLFGPPEMNEGHFMIPPYTFPAFEPEVLQWPQQ